MASQVSLNLPQASAAQIDGRLVTSMTRKTFRVSVRKSFSQPTAKDTKAMMPQMPETMSNTTTSQLPLVLDDNHLDAISAFEVTPELDLVSQHA